MPPRFFGPDTSDWQAPPASVSPRVALVIGNGAYRQSRLDNPPRDARLIADLLDGLGFDTEVVLDAGKTALETAIVRLGERLDRAGDGAVGFFYFAGHGIQHLGSNYLVPIDAQIPDTRYLKSGAIMVDYLVEELARTPSLANVVVLDACRDNMVRDTGGGITNGLASIKDLPDGTLVAFSTAAGKVAEDGAGDHSPYALALAKQLQTTGRRLEEIFFDVSRDVAEATNNSQRPALFVQGAIPSIILNHDPESSAVRAPIVAEPPARNLKEDPPEAQERPFLPTSTSERRQTALVVASPSDGRTSDMAPGSPPEHRAGLRHWPAFLVAAAGMVAAAAIAGATLVFWPRATSIDLASPATWPLSDRQALITRRPADRSCPRGTTGLIDGLHCLNVSREIGLVWESGRIAPPRASATLLDVTEKESNRCPAAALFETGTHCLTVISPLPAGAAIKVMNRDAEVVGPAVGLLRVAPLQDAECTSSIGEGPVPGYCLLGQARFGTLELVAFGRERYKPGSSLPAEMLTAYEKVGACPTATTAFQNDRFCLVVPVW
jgi:hypothetical protein